MHPTSSNCRPNFSSAATAWCGLLNRVEIAAEDSGAIDFGRALPAPQASLQQRPRPISQL
jgi:hypothetical protein